MERSDETGEKVSTTGTYLTILSDSLKKKLNILRQIQDLNDSQHRCLKTEPVDFDAFEESVTQKGLLIDKINDLDEGFEAVYSKVRDGVLGNTGAYSAQISELKSLIAQITDSSVAIQAQEERNRQAVTASFAERRKAMRGGVSSARAVNQYSRNMSAASFADPFFLDKKK